MPFQQGRNTLRHWRRLE